jgi:uncharacterized membrane protein (UPF0127 family)
MSATVQRHAAAAARLRVKLARSYSERLRGVGRCVSWRDFDALCLPRCRAVHTFALARAIDVVFVAADATVVEVRHRVSPWRVVIARSSAAVDAWEFRAGRCEASDVRAGMSVEAMLTCIGRSPDR